jgi:uncharacterized protein
MTRSAKGLAILMLLAGCSPARLDAFLYSPKPAPDGFELPTTVIPSFDRFQVTTADGETIEGVYVRSSGAHPNETIFYCHGNGTHIGTAWPRIELLYPLGYNLLVFDYRGYGTSTGKPSEPGLMIDVRDMRTALLGKPGVDAARLIYYGRSLGGATCIDLATTAPPAALITESTFSSAGALVRDAVDYDLPPAFLIDSVWDSLSKISTIASPYLNLHGLVDDFVQPKYAIELTRAHRHVNRTTELVLVDGADHGDVPDMLGLDRYRLAVDRFIRSAIK